MSKTTISELESTDVLGIVMFGLGLAVLVESVSVPVNQFTAGVLLMILGTGAVFGRDTFVELVTKLLLQNDEKDGDSESDDETSGSEGDDESDDGEVGIDRPPGEDEVTAAK